MKKFNIEKFIAEAITKRDESLFKKDMIKYEDELSSKINEKSVLVIGGAGTIGSSFIKEILNFKPKSITVFDTNENGLTELTRNLRSSNKLFIPEIYKTYPISFSSKLFYDFLNQHENFDIVANFAAHKHVRSEKDALSVRALLENNIINAGFLLENLCQKPPSNFFCVSTDKAANPVNVMGASKKIMEEMILSYRSKFPVTTARFANVAFSNGSLLDGFLKRLSKFQPLSAPLSIKRYFVTPKESGQICLMSCLLGDSGDIFFPKLDIDDMSTFSEIADRLLFEIGYKPIYCDSEDEAKQIASEIDNNSKEYPVYYFKSNTTGEKSFEEFYTQNEEIDFDKFKALGVIKNSINHHSDDVISKIKSLEASLNNVEFDKKKIIIEIQKILPDFHHLEKGKNLDEVM